MKRCWTGIESYFPLHRVRKWYFRHSGIPIFLLKLKMCRQESEVQIIQSFGWPAAGFRAAFCHPHVSLWLEYESARSGFLDLKGAGFALGPSDMAALTQMQWNKHFPFISNCFPLFKQLSITLNVNSERFSVYVFFMYYLQRLTLPKWNGNKCIRLTECT